jgi:hypothetical protein
MWMRLRGADLAASLVISSTASLAFANVEVLTSVTGPPASASLYAKFLLWFGS